MGEEPPRPPPALGSGWRRELPHRSGQNPKLLRPLRIHGHVGLALQLGQPLAELLITRWIDLGAIQRRQAQNLHLLGSNAACRFFGHPIGQKAVLVAKQAIAGKGAGVHGFSMQQVHARHRGAPALQESRHQKRCIKGAELRADGLELQREMAPQGGIAPAHDHPVVNPLSCGVSTISSQLFHGLFQGLADPANPFRSGPSGQGPGIRQNKQQRGWVPQPLQQGGLIPLQQQGTAVHRLRSGGVVIEDDDFEATGHGTIVP